MPADAMDRGRREHISLPSVTAVILNTNRRMDTLACIASLIDDGYPRLQMLILDNGSTDGSIEAIQAEYPQARIHRLAENLGYAGNNNVGLRLALERGADWVLVLNEDVVLGADSIERMLGAAEGDERAGIVGPLVLHYDEPQVIQSAGGLLGAGWQSTHIGQNTDNQGQFNTPRQVDWVSGCCLLARRAMIEALGGFDERFFYYWEETEWCLRARRAGWRVYLVPTANVWHKGVQRNYQPGPNTTYYWGRNWLKMLAKHHAPPSVWIIALSILGRSLLSWTVRPKYRSQVPHRDALLEGIVDFARGRSGMRAGGRDAQRTGLQP